MQSGSETTARKRQSPARLLAQALGGPAAALGKADRLVRAVAGYTRQRELEERLARLTALGVIDRAPTHVQLVVGAVDMVRFWIHPAAADYYQRQGINYTFHQLLRFLDEPASLVDPVGFFSTRDGIIGHLMQVVHANPLYDLQLLSSYDDGLDQLELQLEQMLAGTHPRAASIGAIVEEADYHRRLLDFTRLWRRDPRSPPPLRENVEASTELSAIERTFGSLPSAMRYFSHLPTSPLAAVTHLVTVRTFPHHLGETSP